MNRLPIAAVLLVLPSHLGAQPVRPAPCPPEQVASFDFLVGEWQGRLYELTGADSAFKGITAVVTATKILNGCATEERWHFDDKGVTESDVAILRAFDAGSQRWHYTGFSTTNEYFTFDGERDGPVWRFYHTLTVAGKPVHLRISWIPTPWGYSEQIARSTDEGKTWVNTRHLNYTKRGA
jgi:hypothetical protein